MKRQELIEKWLEALESGKYKQGVNRLVKNDEKYGHRFCCLGVACDVAGLDIQDLVDTDQSELPPRMTKRLGISGLGMFETNIRHHGKYYECLADLNDRNVKFKTIARIIREQLEAKNFKKP